MNVSITVENRVELSFDEFQRLCHNTHLLSGRTNCFVLSCILWIISGPCCHSFVKLNCVFELLIILSSDHCIGIKTSLCVCCKRIPVFFTKEAWKTPKFNFKLAFRSDFGFIRKCFLFIRTNPFSSFIRTRFGSFGSDGTKCMHEQRQSERSTT